MKTYVTDPDHDALLIDVTFTGSARYALYVLYRPALKNSGYGNTGWSEGRALLARRADAAVSARSTSSSFTISVKVRSSTMPSSSVGDYDLVRKGLSATSGGYWELEMIPNSARTKTLSRPIRMAPCAA